MKYFFLIAAFNALFFAILILQKKKVLQDKILTYWLIYLGVYTGSYALLADTLFNEKFGLNFFDFINQYRIKEVKARMANPKFDNLSLLGIAFESGFNTKSAFNRVFKKMTGFTPSEYKKQL